MCAKDYFRLIKSTTILWEFAVCPTQITSQALCKRFSACPGLLSQASTASRIVISDEARFSQADGALNPS